MSLLCNRKEVLTILQKRNFQGKEKKSNDWHVKDLRELMFYLSHRLNLKFEILRWTENPFWKPHSEIPNCSKNFMTRLEKWYEVTISLFTKSAVSSYTRKGNLCNMVLTAIPVRNWDRWPLLLAKQDNSSCTARLTDTSMSTYHTLHHHCAIFALSPRCFTDFLTSSEIWSTHHTSHRPLLDIFIPAWPNLVPKLETKDK